MPEYIEQETALQFVFDACAECMDACEEFDGIYADCNQCMLEGVKLKLRDLHTADVRPVKRGHWVKRMEEHATQKYTSFTPIWSCSECGLEYDPALAPRIHFCYNCGADLQEG